jgi:hypothetical protein
MLTRNELSAVLRGLRGLAHFEAAGFAQFDTTPSGFWKSFWAAALCLPVWAIDKWEQIHTLQPNEPVHFLALHGLAYAVSWLAFPLLMVRVSRFLGRWPRYFTFMVAYNWFQVVQSVAWLPLLLLTLQGDAAPRDMVAVLWLVLYAVLLAYGWFIARVGLKVETGTAIALVLIDVLLGMLIDGVTAMLA